MMVGIKADAIKETGDIPFLKYFFKIDCPAGFGAFAMIVSPPPVTAPVTTAYLRESDKLGTNVLK